MEGSSCEAEPFTCVILFYLWVDGNLIELNSWYSASVWELAGMKSLHTYIGIESLNTLFKYVSYKAPGFYCFIQETNLSLITTLHSIILLFFI